MRNCCPLFFAIILLLCYPTLSYTFEAPGTNCRTIDIRADQRPDSDGPPTEVSVGLRVIDVTQIEDISQTISVDFLVTQEWNDERLIAFEGCQFDLDKVWIPQVDIVNSGRLFTRLQKSVEVFGQGRVRQVQRYSGALVFVYDAHDFPFDKQDIVITLLSEKYSDEDVVVTINDEVTGRKPAEFNIPDWSISKVNAQIVTKYFEILNSNHSAYEFHIPAERRSGFYVWKVIVPLLLIVFMSWTVFWINPSQVGPQISMSATSMLTLIAFQFAMGHLLPKLSYFTIMDQFVTGSTILVFLALLESVTTNYLVTTGRENLALKLDRYCCWIFPITFFIFIYIIFSV